MSFVSTLLDRAPKLVSAVAAEVRSEVRALERNPAQAVGLAKDVFDAAQYLASHPPKLSQIDRLGSAIHQALVTGHTQVITANLPPYPKLDPSILQGAMARGAGQSVEQPFIASMPDGTITHEPVNLVVTGTQAQLEAALIKAGWERAPELTRLNELEAGAKAIFGLDQNVNGPVSTQYLGGQPELIAFNKNDDYDAGRDHLRVWPTTPDPATGQPRWQIAASRDLGMNVSPPQIAWDGKTLQVIRNPGVGHRSDRQVDGERDLVMHDLLGTGLVKDWAAVNGERPAGTPTAQQPDGKLKLNGQWVTDGRVDTVKL